MADGAVNWSQPWEYSQTFDEFMAQQGAAPIGGGVGLPPSTQLSGRGVPAPAAPPDIQQLMLQQQLMQQVLVQQAAASQFVGYGLQPTAGGLQPAAGMPLSQLNGEQRAGAAAAPPAAKKSKKQLAGGAPEAAADVSDDEDWGIATAAGLRKKKAAARVIKRAETAAKQAQRAAAGQPRRGRPPKDALAAVAPAVAAAAAAAMAGGDLADSDNDCEEDGVAMPARSRCAWRTPAGEALLDVLIMFRSKYDIPNGKACARPPTKIALFLCITN